MTLVYQAIVSITLMGQAAVCALQSPAQVPAIDSLTRPPTTYSQGTVSTSAEWEISGNLMVTGNVTGGKHLQSQAPYTDTSRMQTTLSTTYLDSFYRQAATSFQPPSYDNAYVPFYSSAATTARTHVHQPAALSPMQTATGMMSQPRTGPSPHVGPLRLAPAVLPPQVTPGIPVSTFWQETLARARYDYDSEVPPEIWDRLVQALSVPESPAPEEDTRIPDPGIPEMQMQQKPEGADPREDATAHPAGEADAESMAWEEGRSDLYAQRRIPGPNTVGLLSSSLMETPPEFRGQALAGRLEEVRLSRFEAWMAIGQAYIKKTEFAKAVDAFTLAAQYETEHPRALAGKSFALLALGEYTRSALFLGRTLTAMPTYAEYPSILPLILGEDRVTTCLQALQTRIAITPTPECLFLAGYLHYQLGDLVVARQLLVTAQASGDRVPGIRTLLSTVQTRLAVSGPG
jgi:tetratricopeptide (TPR) repeat protein